MIILGGITLPEDLIWEDEYAWSGVDARANVSRGGYPIIFEQSVSSGRPVTLTGGPNHAWIAHNVLQSVFDLAGIPLATYDLVMGTTTRRVRFANEDPPAVTAIPVREMPDDEYIDGDWFHSVVIKLMEIAV